ncbi:hypothetical protein LCGC14_1774370, partial [marine sediment metagenome]
MFFGNYIVKVTDFFIQKNLVIYANIFPQQELAKSFISLSSNIVTIQALRPDFMNDWATHPIGKQESLFI